VLFYLVNRTDVRMIERRGRASFALETLQRLRVRCEFVREELQRHLAAEPDVLRPVDHAHSALADYSQDAVMGNSLAYHRQRHAFWGRNLWGLPLRGVYL